MKIALAEEFVVPFVGTWIEIQQILDPETDCQSRTLRGYVD